MRMYAGVCGVECVVHAAVSGVLVWVGKLNKSVNSTTDKYLN